MAKVTNFFAGANSGGGFRNLFTELIDPEIFRDFIILKGGPGVGKNTFMREIGISMEQAGYDVEYLRCSGDPDSLDGVIIPALRCGGFSRFSSAKPSAIGSAPKPPQKISTA